MKLKGKVAIITGGSRGQGAAEAKLFAKEGASVIIGDILDDEGEEVANEIEDSDDDISDKYIVPHEALLEHILLPDSESKPLLLYSQV